MLNSIMLSSLDQLNCTLYYQLLGILFEREGLVGMTSLYLLVQSCQLLFIQKLYFSFEQNSIF
jgi:hypothetical protein